MKKTTNTQPTASTTPQVKQYTIERLSDGRFFSGVIFGLETWGKTFDGKPFAEDSHEVGVARRNPSKFRLHEVL